jgi:site-specific DNA-methyltransferase (adenine-specific)
MPNLVKESAKYGNYENKLLRQNYPKIEVISVEEILQGKKMHLPTAIDIVKDAERKVKDGIVGKLL